MNRRRLSIDVPSLLWAITFAALATLGIVAALDLPIDWNLVLTIGPAALIGLGIVGLVLNHRLSD